MKAIVYQSHRATYADYLAAEQMSECRHEYLDGVIVAMAGGSDEHNAISGRIAGLCVVRLSGACRYYSPDQRFWIAQTVRGRYSDGSIICGPPEHPPHDNQATINPIVVFEVLSPSTQGDDEGDKRRDFQTLASLQAYVLVAQDARCVTVHRRDDRGEWRGAPDVYRDEQRFELPKLSTPISVAELYEGVLDSSGRSLLKA
ncbi:MAG TPA: Uma2 family endonuclease [Kofleriaceae bacterium]|nr:Uma2 family endonuclease [Kofleriaceae bacterium]